MTDQPITRTLLRDQAYLALLRAIIFGELAPGAPLRDADLAQQLGLSRTPVREALARLADDGLVETKANAYTRVAPLDDAATRDAAVVHQTLHGLAARLAADGRFGAEHADRAAQLNRTFAAALDAGDLVGALAADDDLHLVFVHAAGNAQLAGSIARLVPLLRRHALQRFASLPARRSVQAHARLIAAAAAGEVAEAGRLAEENWATLVDLIDGAAAPTPAPHTGAVHRAAR